MNEFDIYNKLNGTGQFVSDQLPIFDYRPKISRLDLDKGYITRYFVQRRNSKNSEILEIDKSTYNRVKFNTWYLCVEMEWRISGKKEDEFKGNIRTFIGAESSNRESLELACQTLPNLKFKVRNLLQYYKE